jgi:hypothetical protein
MENDRFGSTSSTNINKSNKSSIFRELISNFSKSNEILFELTDDINHLIREFGLGERPSNGQEKNTNFEDGNGIIGLFRTELQKISLITSKLKIIKEELQDLV